MRVVCPIHGMPDCSPLLNGCSKVNLMYEAAARDEARNLHFELPRALVLNATDRRVIASFMTPGEPVSKARARFTSYGSKVRTYTPEKTLTAESRVRAAYVAAGGAISKDTNAAFGVVARFYCETRQRRDVDNMAKLILDGLNGVAWPDDVQVLEVQLLKSFVPKGSARTEVMIYEAGDMGKPKYSCKECGVSFLTYPSWLNKSHCSRDCQLAERRRNRIRVCEMCAKSFDPGKPSKARYCSTACKAASAYREVVCATCRNPFRIRSSSIRASNQCSQACRDASARRARDASAEKAKGTCATCGGPTSKKSATNCKVCQHMGKKVPA